MTTSSDLPSQDAKSLTFLETIDRVTSIHGFDSRALPWLGRFHRMLHAELTGALPDRIQQAWERNELAAYVDALADFERAFTEAVELYRRWKEMENV